MLSILYKVACATELFEVLGVCIPMAESKGNSTSKISKSFLLKGTTLNASTGCDYECLNVLEASYCKLERLCEF